MNQHTNAMQESRVDRFAELLADGVGVVAAGKAMGLTKGETASTMRHIRADLGEQAR